MEIGEVCEHTVLMGKMYDRTEIPNIRCNIAVGQLYRFGVSFASTGKEDNTIAIFASPVDAPENEGDRELGGESSPQSIRNGNPADNVLNENHPVHNRTIDLLERDPRGDYGFEFALVLRIDRIFLCPCGIVDHDRSSAAHEGSEE